MVEKTTLADFNKAKILGVAYEILYKGKGKCFANIYEVKQNQDKLYLVDYLDKEVSFPLQKLEKYKSSFECCGFRPVEDFLPFKNDNKKRLRKIKYNEYK